ncbi:MAG TPA: Ig-like domain-containing protein, partial [Ilumatobacteraceae bacterium]
ASTRTIVASSGTPSGSVDYYVDGLLRATAALSSSGQATYATSTLAVGVHTVTAVYSGDGNFIASTSNTINQRIR